MFWTPFTPASGTVDLYYADMDDSSLDVERITSVLSDQELARANAFRDHVHRRRFMIGRGALRGLLGNLMDKNPAALDVRVGKPFGKPDVLGGPAFNLSHSDGHLLIGIAPEGRLGVDVEVARQVVDVMALARDCCSAQERIGLLKLDPEDRSHAFLRIWTLKESLLKAIGTGLSAPPNQVSMALSHLEGSQLVDSNTNAIGPAFWCVRAVELTEGLIAAVSWDRTDFALRRSFFGSGAARSVLQGS
ncbi:4'-phosphopantetheinyl transferase family protein [Thiocapsa marina]|uniref:4'-phosphopantetheinyl transferase n=1 Tax=Thiocapsa marina 5811 TaxID=768671 RepID=F9UAS1_9GAMM|nr:4'-phosphopantetheinyl transferase superfamily protein [Thiocapsa marina]EGV18539.1 4'-phosphopantetheinyl transferase [Thiocapsa marina 5811]